MNRIKFIYTELKFNNDELQGQKRMIQSVQRALTIMELLDESSNGQPLGVLEISRLIGLKQPTVHNFLQTLLQADYVAQEKQTSKYCLTEKARFLGWNGTRKRQLRDIAEPIAQRLFDACNETVLMVIQDKNIRTTLFRIDSSRSLTVRVAVCMDGKFYSSATGRCLLCGMPDEQREYVYRVNKLPQKGEWDGVRSRNQIKQALDSIRKAGHAVYRSEGIVAIGAPVFLPNQSVNAALGLYIPECRLNADLQKELINSVMNAANEITDACDTGMTHNTSL